ncbi:MAG: uncharacterized protein A8A55_3076 [Amphiamblys sp. WSBS2006]|nr:MAG: uncharacterized protein A8A55_3076 [Amphiamblys sp. WSBS2006]
MECLGNTVFVPVIEIEANCWKEHWGGFDETFGIYIKTNALVENISPKTKQMIGEMIAQKETVVKTKNGYQKLVFEEDLKHGEQGESEESEEQLITEHQDQEVCLKEGSKGCLRRYGFSDYQYGDYED